MPIVHTAVSQGTSLPHMLMAPVLAQERQEHSANAVSALSVRDDAPQSAVLHHQQALEATIAKYEAVKADLADHEQMQATLEQAVADAATATQQAAQVFQDQQREQAHSAALQQELDALKQELGGRLKDITNQVSYGLPCTAGQGSVHVHNPGEHALGSFDRPKLCRCCRPIRAIAHRSDMRVPHAGLCMLPILQQPVNAGLCGGAGRTSAS